MKRGVEDERGAVAVMLAVLMPLVLIITAWVVGAGNAYVHKRKLQAMVDAAALAAATEFGGCFGDPSGANSDIGSTALRYAGDVNRDPASLNRQVQEPEDVHVVLNASRYWQDGDPVDGSTLDNTLSEDGRSGAPCSALWLDVKATDDGVPNLLGYVPFAPDAKATARVEIRKTYVQEDVMPWAIPWAEPEGVGVVFVDEDNANSVIDTLSLTGPVSGPDYAEWSSSKDISPSDENIGVVVVVGKATNPDLSLGTLGAICGQAPGDVVCYGQTTPLGFIQSHDDDATASATAPVIREVVLETSPNQSPNEPNCVVNPGRPYYFLDQGCRIIVRAVVDFGMTGDCRNDAGGNPPGVKCRVELVSGGELQWSSTDTPGFPGLGTWSATVNLPDTLGRQLGGVGIGLRARSLDVLRLTDTNVAAPYVDDSATGIVEYLSLSDHYVPDGPGNPTTVTVGLRPPLVRDQFNLLRFSSATGERTQGVDCDVWLAGDPSGDPDFPEEIENGCSTPIALNYSEATGTWRDYDCVDYDPDNQASPTFRYTLPRAPDSYPPPAYTGPAPDCLRIETGAQVGPVRGALHNRFETPCTPNNWPNPEDDDARWVVLLITDWTKFEGVGQSPESSVPTWKYGAFYVTGWTKWEETVGCPGNQPRPKGSRKNGADVWGYFREFVGPPSDGIPSEETCAAGVEPCVAVMTK